MVRYPVAATKRAKSALLTAHAGAVARLADPGGTGALRAVTDPVNNRGTRTPRTAERSVLPYPSDVAFSGCHTEVSTSWRPSTMAPASTGGAPPQISGRPGLE